MIWGYPHDFGTPHIVKWVVVYWHPKHIFHDISWYFMIFHDISWYFMYHLLGFSIITNSILACDFVPGWPGFPCGGPAGGCGEKWNVNGNSWEIAGSVVGIAIVTYWLWLRLSAQPAEVLDKFDKFLKYYSYCQLLQFSGLSDSYECKCPFIVILVGAIEVINGYNHGRSLRSGDIVEACRGYIIASIVMFLYPLELGSHT